MPSPSVVVKLSRSRPVAGRPAPGRAPPLFVFKSISFQGSPGSPDMIGKGVCILRFFWATVFGFLKFFLLQFQPKLRLNELRKNNLKSLSCRLRFNYDTKYRNIFELRKC